MTLGYFLVALLALVIWLAGCVWLTDRSLRNRKREAEWSEYRQALYALAFSTSPRPSLLGVEDNEQSRSSLVEPASKTGHRSVSSLRSGAPVLLNRP